MMRVEGDDALQWEAISLSSFKVAHNGPLKKADDQTGEIEWTDPTGEAKAFTFGPHAIRLVRKGRF